MLVDIPDCAPALGRIEKDKLHFTGMYLAKDRWSWQNTLRQDWYEFAWEWPESKEDKLSYFMDRMKREIYFSEYGICELPNQFLAHKEYGKLIQSLPESFAVVFTHLIKDSSDGEMRWHKQGPFIGRVKPQYEYFKDETKIDEVYAFHIFRKK